MRSQTYVYIHLTSKQREKKGIIIYYMQQRASERGFFVYICVYMRIYQEKIN